MRRTWEADFVAVSSALGEPMSSIVEALGGDGTLRATDLVQALEVRPQSARAIVLAAALAGVVADLERLELR